MDNSLHFSSAKHNWATRNQTFYDIQLELGRSYSIDPCAEHETAKCLLYITKEDDLFSIGNLREHFKIGLSEELHVFVNPPYGREQRKFIDYFKKQCDNDAYMVADILIPARTDVKLFHEVIIPYATSIRFIRGRITFGSDAYWEELWEREYLEDGRKNTLYGKHGKMNPAAFPSMVVSFGEKQPLNISPLVLTKARYPDRMATLNKENINE